MPGAPLGSVYGAGPYGKGLYSRLPTKEAGFALRSGGFPFGMGAFGVGPFSRAAAGSSITVGGHVMWQDIEVPACQPWTLIAACGCPSPVRSWPA